MNNVIAKGVRRALRDAKAEWKARRSEEGRRKSLKLNRRITLGIAIVLASMYLFALSPLGAMFSGGQSSQSANNQPDQSLVGAYSQLNSALQPYNKAVTLKSSAAAALTAYPSSTGSSALSSAALDEQTGNVSYQRGMGKGDVAVAESPSATDPCNGYNLPTVSGGGKTSSSLSIPPCPSFQAGSTDFLAGTNGIFMQIPAELTTGNDVVRTSLGVVQAAALACIVPLIVMIGFNVMMGAITTRFANAVESLARLIPAAVAIGFVGTLVQFVFDFEAALVALLKSQFTNTDVSSILLPVDAWLAILGSYLAMGIMLMIAKSVAPLLIEVLGTGATIGVFVAVGIEIAIYAIILGTIRFLILTLFDMALCVQLLMRIVLINFYIIMSPMAIVASILPGRQGTGFTREWIMGFLSLVASHFAQVIVLFLGLSLLDAVHLKGFSEGQLLPELVKYGTLTLVMRTPGLFRSNATGMLSQIGSSAAGVAAGPYMAFM